MSFFDFDELPERAPARRRKTRHTIHDCFPCESCKELVLTPKQFQVGELCSGCSDDGSDFDGEY